MIRNKTNSAVVKIIAIAIILIMMLPNFIIAVPTSQDVTKSNKDRVVVLDPGHGRNMADGFDFAANGFIYNSEKGEWGEWRHWKSGTYGEECNGNGCCASNVGASGEWYKATAGLRDTEPDLNLTNALAAKKYLEEMGYTVRITRTDSTSTHESFSKRASYCFPNNDTSQAPDAELYVCIHSNAGGGTGSAYMSTNGGTYDQKYISSNYAQQCNKAGEIINNKITSTTSLSKHGSGVISGQPDLIAFHKNPCTTAYLEIGFFDNAADLSILKSESDKIGKAIAEGVNEYLQSVESSVNTGSTASSTSNVTTELKVRSNEEKFLGLWKNSTGKYEKYYNNDGTINQNALYNPDGKLVKYGSAGSPVENIFGASDWFFDLLALSERTQNHEQLMRYLMYVYSGNDYGVKEFDFSVFDAKSFKSASSGSNWNKFLKMLKAWEGGFVYDETGTKYKVIDDGDGNPTVGWGLDIEHSGKKAEIVAAGYDTNYGAYIDVDFVDALLIEELKGWKDTIDAYTSGLNLTEYQKHVMYSRAFNGGSYGYSYKYNGHNFIDAYNSYWNDADNEFGVTANDAMFNHNLYSKYMYKPDSGDSGVLPGLVSRRKSEWILFKTGYYDYRDGTGDFWAEGGNILEKADECHKYMEQNGYRYIEGPLPSTASDARSYKSTCCSTYVHWVICEAGIEPMETTLIHRASSLFTHIQDMGDIITSYEELEAGDIVFMTGVESGTDTVSGKNGGSYRIGHVQIYAGDGQWYNAGGNESISRVNPYAQGESYVKGRFQVAVRIAQ